MKSKLIKLIPLILAGLFSFSLFTAIPTHATSICDNNSIPEDVRAANGCKTGTKVAELPTVVVNIINAVIATVGLICVVYIVYGGIQYVVSGGDAGKLQKAKNTILYALVGLVICALAFAIVNFVVANIIRGESAKSYTSKSDCTSAGYTWENGTCK